MAKTLHNLWRKAGQRQLQNFLSTLKTYQVMATEPLFGELAKRYGYGARKGFDSVGAAKRSGELYNIVEDVIISEFDRRYPKRSKKLMPHHLKDDIFFTAEEKSDRISRMGNVARKDELKRRRESEFRIKELKMKEVMGEKNYKAFRKYGVLYLMKQHGGKSDINYKDLFFGEDVDLKSMIFNQIEVGE